VLILKIRLKNKIMLITRTVTKKILETIVHETFSNLGVLVSSSLLDSLKLLGFYYATTAGISINIEDLKTPDIKKEIIKKANAEIVDISEQWQQGFVSDTERFQSIIDSWNIATESLKNRIVDYYQLFDPANNLYIMAFSGARGNMSQVRQLVGMRGLMSDQEGKIIDLPIQTNFREGLSSIDYIISSYGARKGIVDTALKTADSGYLTRRLIYLAQDLIIREFDCGTKAGLIVLFKKKTNPENLVGRNLINARRFKYPYDIISDENIPLEGDFLKKLKEWSPVILNVRSSLTCKVNGSICQKCYGWDLSREKLISLGEAVGIIAAQSIGEPGTQLTMRTFHTGGIFTSETVKQIVSPFSGKIIIPPSLKTLSYRTSHGTMVLKLQQEARLNIVNWKGIQKKVFLVFGSYLYLNSSCFVKKGQIIAEYSNQTSLPSGRRLRPIYTPSGGEIRFENLLVRKLSRNKRTIKVTQDDGVLWIASGKIFPVPKEIKYLFPKILTKTKPFAKLKLVTPYEGIAILKNETITIVNQKTQIVIDLVDLEQVVENCSLCFSSTIKNYQYVDQYTILSYIEFFPGYEGRVYSVRKKEAEYITTLFLITESDVWKINTDQTTDFSFFRDKKKVIREGTFFNTTSKFSRSGFFLKKDGFKMIFQSVTPLFLSRGTILNYKQGDFVFEKKIFAMLVNYTQQTEDIVQGLPKIEELVEARRPKIKCYLSYRPGVFLNFKTNEQERILKDSIIKCISHEPLTKKRKKRKKT
jgi:DNA-directed RNA polymerase subunit beta'